MDCQTKMDLKFNFFWSDISLEYHQKKEKCPV